MNTPRFTRNVQTFETQSFVVAVLPGYGSGVVCMSGAFEAGPWHAAPGKEPVASILASLLDEGTKRRSRETFRNLLEEKGTTLNFWADGRYVLLSLRATTHALPEALELLFEALLEPSLSDSARIQIQEREAAARTHDAEDTRLQARHALSRLLLAPHSAGFRVDPLTEREQTVAVSSQDILQFYKKTFSGKIKIAVVGDIRPEDMEKLVVRSSRGWKSDEQSNARSMNPAPITDIVTSYISIPGKESVDVFMGSYVPLPQASPEFPAFLAAIDLLGGGFSDHLMQTVRDRDGLTYGTVARVRGRESGTGFYWFAWAMFGNTLFQKGAAALQKEIGVFLESGISQKRYAEKTEEISGRLAVAFSSPPTAVSEILSGMLIANDPSHADRYVEELQRITADDAQKAARTYLTVQGISSAGAIDKSGNLL